MGEGWIWFIWSIWFNQTNETDQPVLAPLAVGSSMSPWALSGEGPTGAISL